AVVAFCTAISLKYKGGQVILFPRGLLLRAGSRLYKYCWATAPYLYFYFFYVLGWWTETPAFWGAGVLACGLLYGAPWIDLEGLFEYLYGAAEVVDFEDVGNADFVGTVAGCGVEACGGGEHDGLVFPFEIGE
ncbi:MAG: hypothetical protein RIS47_2052, partial [Bacteroidota bacterium]